MLEMKHECWRSSPLMIWGNGEDKRAFGPACLDVLRDLTLEPQREACWEAACLDPLRASNLRLERRAYRETTWLDLLRSVTPQPRPRSYPEATRLAFPRPRIQKT
jgi:hypothetical protein